MEWNLTDERKAQYSNMLKTAQDLEMTIGSSQYRIQKLLNMRADLDGGLKKWWDEVLKELALDPKLDYMITQEGSIREVPKQGAPVTAPESTVGTNATELK